MRYLDANVFVYAAAYDDPHREAAQDVLRGVADRGDGVTAALTVDEVVWALMRIADRGDALAEGRTMLSLPGVRFLDVTARDVHRALLLMEDHPGLAPRDAVHAAVALNSGVFTIVSDDPDFDDVAGLDREALE